MSVKLSRSSETIPWVCVFPGRGDNRPGVSLGSVSSCSAAGEYKSHSVLPNLYHQCLVCCKFGLKGHLAMEFQVTVVSLSLFSWKRQGI